jgi:hypothetical protein
LAVSRERVLVGKSLKKNLKVMRENLHSVGVASAHLLLKKLEVSLYHVSIGVKG